MFICIGSTLIASKNTKKGGMGGGPERMFN